MNRRFCPILSSNYSAATNFHWSGGEIFAQLTEHLHQQRVLAHRHLKSASAMIHGNSRIRNYAKIW